MERSSVYVLLNQKEKKMLHKLINKYGFHFESEFIRYLIRELYNKGKIELTPVDIVPLEKEIT